ncbi:MAG: cupin domain-containing protein [Rhizomicrobium sp.]|jgi:hypothetical protein
MILQEAQRIVEQVLAPLTLDEFLDDVLGKRFVKVPCSTQSDRISLLGADPESVILGAYRDAAPHLGFHSASPSGPAPAVEAVADARAFRTKIDSFHSRGYTVRVPQPRGLAPKLDEFLRALEFLFQQPASCEVFWSRGDARAPAHHDDYDLIAIQLKGNKRWFISTERSELPNVWNNAASGPPPLTNHAVVEVVPGDMLYLPRGTGHRVDALSESLHLAIGFNPLTLRDAINAAVDHFSDIDRHLRETVGARIAAADARRDFNGLYPAVNEGVARLLQLCSSPEFLAQAMQQRASRAVKGLKATPPPALRITLGPDSRLRHRAATFCHLSFNGERIVFSHPGGQIFIHPGVEPSLRYIAQTPEFRVRDVPGEMGQDVRIALVQRLVTSGFLDVVSEQG